MKKIILILIFFNLALNIFSQSAKIKYLKGNISEKTEAVKEAIGSDSWWICENALDFVLENKEIIGDDRELDALAVATVYSINNDYVTNLSDKQKFVLMNKFIDLFNKYNKSPVVQTSVISKVISQKDILNHNNFTAVLNSYISKNNINQIDSTVAKSIFSAFETIGNNETFLILYTLRDNEKYKNYSQNIENALVALIPISMNEVLNIIHQKDIAKITSIFNLVKNNLKISTNSVCEIAENVLNESILLSEDSSKITDDYIRLQLDALEILSKNNWTRASSIALSYFETAKRLYSENRLKNSDMQLVISSLCNIAPVNAVLPLSKYLEELNSKKEQNEEISSDVVLTVIQTLGAIGDKSAFDSLLAVTYLDYPESVLTAARDALSGLKW